MYRIYIYCYIASRDIRLYTFYVRKIQENKSRINVTSNLILGPNPHSLRCIHGQEMSITHLIEQEQIEQK